MDYLPTLGHLVKNSHFQGAMWVDFPYMEHLDIWDDLGVQSALSMSEISTWLGADVRYWILPKDHGSWSLHLRCLQRGSCGNYDVAGLRIDGGGLKPVLENAFFLTQLLLRKTHMKGIGFWKPFTIRVECKSWVSKHLETIRVFVSKWGKVPFAAGRGVSWGKKRNRLIACREWGSM